MLNTIIKTFLKSTFFYFKYYSTILFDKKLREQHFNYKKIPIFIVSFNQLKYLKQLVTYLNTNNYLNIIIIDNNSTYPPLLSYLKDIESKVKVIRLKQNLGHLVFWELQQSIDVYTKGYYVVTDPDIIPLLDCPKDFLNYFKSILLKKPTKTKVGFSLDISNLPEENPNKLKIEKWELKFWKNKTIDGNYNADIDTTFALYRPFYKYHAYHFYNSIRTKSPYTANHAGWDVDPNNLTEEQVFYMKTVNSSSSWLNKEEGKHIYN